jgi:2-polyprenyl-6-methoxyphenol hydroxylase-like FAD-dependent oxidoreductase
LHIIVSHPDGGWNGKVGLVTDLLDENMLSDGDADVYLCGPAPMVDATRNWLDNNGIHRIGLYYEKFVPSGAARRRTPARLDYAGLDLGQVQCDGRGTAVVIGGSIAGIAAAKVLSESFDRVIVLEKDGRHSRREGRPGAAQGWHLHHLLTAGQIELERIFPGIVDDMVREGAFKVDMADQYRIRLGGTWKKPGTSDIQIVCAGRPLLEWCVRRRLDDEPRIEFRYEAEVGDLVYDRDGHCVIGVAVDRDGELEVVPAEFVVDASGKNTRIPEFLEHLGIGAPEVEQDIINCFYSTMHHHVPPERQWQDKVMVICYAYRPYEDTYAAQYYTDSSRTILSTSLVAYNCYSPPRTAREFREFADLMPSPVVGENIDGLEPASPIYNFRYPNMLRLRYEKMRNLPRSLLVVGDAYTSADPVSGLGMTLALKEVREMQLLLAKYGAGHRDLPRRYYRKISRMADTAWFVIREQNLRFDWIKDVDRKRPFYFAALTWYMDRVIELVHDDLDTYREFLAVVHLVKPPSALMMPKVAGRVLGKWARTRLSGRKTLIAGNYQDRTVPVADRLDQPEKIPAA